MRRRQHRGWLGAAIALIVAWAGFRLAAQAQPGLNPAETVSASGQFIISALKENSPFYRRPGTGTNTAILQLQPPWLAVSAERFKASIWRILEEKSLAWHGKIFVVLHPARTLDESVTITPQPFINVWNCRLEMPDMISRDRYARAMSAVILLELANRSAPMDGHSAELPAWLVDGLARQVSQSEEAQAILSAPTKTVGGLAQTRTEEKQRGLDPLTAARRVLENSPPLTFDQLNWPSSAQMNGEDGGVYLASAQLFLDSLLKLNSGEAKLRAFLAALPSCENWQSAFYKSFRENFRSPLDVEKWWALRAVAFAVHSPGPRWTVALSRQKLDALLAVPVGVRYSSNSLPERTEVTLQAVIRNFENPQRDEILRAKLRDLEITELRLASPLAGLADGYRATLTEFLGESRSKSDRLMLNKHNAGRKTRPSASVTIKKLDALDARRRTIEAGLERSALPVPAP